MPNKIYTSLIIIFYVSTFAYSQEQYVLNQTQVKFNPFLYNPAFAGLKGYGDVSLSVRQNIKRIDGGPRTQIISFYNRHSKLTRGVRKMGYNQEASRIGYGAYFYNDVEGPFRNQGLVTSFSYHIPLDDKGTEQISFGIGPSISYSSINTNNLDVYDDPYLLFSNWKGASPDFVAGIQYYGKYASAGFSSMNIFQIPLNMGENISETKKYRQYFFNGSGRFYVYNNILLEPGFLLYTNTGEFSDMLNNFDINMTAYIDMFSVIATYRNNIGMSVAGAIQFEYFFGGLAYEIPFSNTIGVNYGTIEVNVGIKFGQGRNKFGDNRYR